MSAVVAPPAVDESRWRLSVGGLLRSEWIKLRSLRSTVWCAAVLIALILGIGLLIAVALTSSRSEDSGVDRVAAASLQVQVATVGIAIAQVIAAVLGALTISGEYGTGMIRSTLTAVPKRIPAILAKAAVLFAATFVIGLVAIALTALVTAAIFAGKSLHADFGSAAVLAPLLGGALYLGMISLLAFGIGLLLRNSAAAISISLALLLVVPNVILLIGVLSRQQWITNIAALMPSSAGAELYHFSSGDPVDSASGAIVLTGGTGFLVLLAWVVVLLVLGLVLLRRRDA